MEELDEIHNREEELYDDIIEKKDKLRYRHPLFIFLAAIALIAILFFSLNYFISFYMSWRKKMEMKRPPEKISTLIH
jgi:predicted metal-dependent phosphoesterase TrpH